MFEFLESLIAIVPPTWWPAIDRYAVVALLVLGGCSVVVWGLDKMDMRDGRRDIKWIGQLLPWLGVLADAVTAIIELGPVQLPKVARFKALWLRARALRASPHPDDVPPAGDW